MSKAFSDVLAEVKGGRKVVCDSRKVEPGCVFVAVRGATENGAKYIPSALEAGAGLVVADSGSVDESLIAKAASLGVEMSLVDDTREAVSALAAAAFEKAGLPSQIVGVTGTNGKTTCSYLLEQLLSSLGMRVGVMGTVNYRWPGHVEPSPLTTPGPLQIHENLAAMSKAGCDAVVMEVSSHALDQKRVGNVPFSAACFTNLTQDHLDFHKDMETYFHAKERLFLPCTPKVDKVAALNIDDPYGVRLAKTCPRSVTYGFNQLPEGLDPESHLSAVLLSQGTQGVSLSMRYKGKEWRLDSPLIGRFNADNLLTVQATALAMGVDSEALKSLESFHGVPGRMERIPNKAGVPVFVDYAHTPDALVNVLQALRGAGFKRIVTVFGCGGNRDKTKRPLMGQAVASLSDVAVVTSDNPRFEDPLDIISDILPGVEGAKEVVVEPDRREATRKAIDLVGSDGCLLVAGKGHEDYQILGAERRHYSDRETVLELLG